MVVTITRRGDAGPTTRVLTCPACETSTPYGISCPSCGDCRFGTWATHQRANGDTVRVKKCVHCGHRIRTRERVESATA
jgi:DNA-directed RNA polymerase subunit M/transcription elongation factor TFIIS